MTDILQKTSAQDGKPFYRINRRTKKGRYRILDSVGQFKYCERVELRGFESLPSGFYRNDGYGLTAGGSFLLQEVHEAFGKKIQLTIVASGRPRLDARGRKAKWVLPHRDLLELNGSVRTVKRQRNEETRSTIRNYLSRFRQFRHFRGSRPAYAPGTLASVLEAEDLSQRLSPEDREHLEGFIPKYLSEIPGTIRAKGKLKIVFDSLDAGRTVYLQKVLREFRRKLGQSVQSESTWQRFLSEHILILRNTYGEVLEKESVTLQGKFPDFMLIDPYSYLDIYEIKKPSTTLLRHDRSRKNYYWDAELSKAISQVENYLHQVQRNCDALVNDLRRNKGLDISIVRPRGYIIAGMRDQLKDTKMRDDFRILNESLKSIDVILYDDLLQNLDTFVTRLATTPPNGRTQRTRRSR